MSKDAARPTEGTATWAEDDSSEGRAAASPRRRSRAKSSASTPGFISPEDVARHRAQANLAELEPTPQDMAHEQSRIEKAERAAARRGSTEGGRDLLASYMDQLRQLPLYTAEQELQQARELEQAEQQTWRLVLEAPRAVALLHALLCEAARPAQDGQPSRPAPADRLPPEAVHEIEALERSYRRASARTRTRDLAHAPARQDSIARLCAILRAHDFDKELLEALMAQLRPEVWSRRVLTGSLAYRLTHADLTEIERARGAAVRTRNHFVRANLRLVVSVARRFHHFRIPFIDLIQEGNVGLMKAVHRFDHARGFRFSTYAHWWIRQSIERAIINKGSQVRLPVHVIDARRQVSRAAAKLTHALGRAPVQQEIADELQLPLERVQQVQEGVQQDPLSLDESLGGDDPRKFLDLMRDKDSPGVDEALIRENTHARVRELLHLLGPIERDIIRRRFGLGNDSDQTLDDIGRLYNLSRERVRQIQAQGLMKMRRMCERRRIE